MEKMPEKREIKETGSYNIPDKDGYLRNQASEELIQERWRGAVDELVDLYKDLYGDSLQAMYLRGSVAKGEAIDGISDLDAIAFTDSDIKVDEEKRRTLKQDLLKRYPFIEDVEIVALPVSKLDDLKGVRLVLKTGGILLHGKDVLSDYPQPQIGEATRIDFKKLEMEHLPEALQELEEYPAKAKQICSWAMKRILRAAESLVQERSQKYTRDLYRCYENFAHFYPEQAREMREVLKRAVYPTDDKEKIKEIIESMGTLVIEESRQLEYYQ